MRVKVRHLIIIPSLGLASCVTTHAPVDNITSLSKTSSTPFCESSVAEIRVNHPTGRVNACDVMADNRFNLTIRPEKTTDPKVETINNSPWYGFRVDPK